MSFCSFLPKNLKNVSQVVYTAGRPPWYDCSGNLLKEPFTIGICGGSASGKTTVANKIIEALDMPWVTLLSMDCFYKVGLLILWNICVWGCPQIPPPPHGTLSSDPGS